MNEPPVPQRGLFRLMEGFPAHTMVILGLVLSLLAPLIPKCAAASVESAQAELEAAKMIREIELKEFNRAQQRAREAEADKPPEDGPTMREREENREKDLKAFEKSLEDRMNLLGKERALVEARTDAAGVRSHLYLHWLGRVLLLLGLLVMTLGATGTRQKVLVAVLLIVLFGSLTGVDLQIGVQAELGGS